MLRFDLHPKYILTPQIIDIMTDKDILRQAVISYIRQKPYDQL